MLVCKMLTYLIFCIFLDIIKERETIREIGFFIIKDTLLKYILQTFLKHFILK